jgi:CubicO group peptidase (beta-lactamase class C family)
VQLSDAITKYLPDSVAANPSLQSVTLLNLSNHTSGLPSIPDNLDPKTIDPANPYKDYTKQMMFAYLESCKLNSKPGDQYVYSNLAVGLLGIILENVSGIPYNQMVKQIITKPLGMNSTEAFLTPLQTQRFTTVYNQDGQPTPIWDWGPVASCGILKSTVNDLLIYTKANMANGTGKLSKAFELTHQITFSKNIKLGLNWHIITINGIDYYFHNGLTGGSSSFLAFNIEKNIAVVVLSNCAESTDALGAGLLKKLTAD